MISSAEKMKVEAASTFYLIFYTLDHGSVGVSGSIASPLPNLSPN